MSGMTRDEIVRRFEQWLDDVLSSEGPPRGIDADMLAALTADDPDAGHAIDRHDGAYTLWEAMTALTQEVKLQGRAFKELHDTLGAETGRAAGDLRAVFEERERELQREIERRCRREALSTLIDLRDRLARGLETVRAVESDVGEPPRRRWLARVFAAPRDEAASATLAALTTGYELGLERLDDTLQELGAREIQCEGEPFDPRSMNAIDREESSAVPAGTVLEVYRRGYEWSGEVFRPAQVKVSWAPAARAGT